MMTSERFMQNEMITLKLVCTNELRRKWKQTSFIFHLSCSECNLHFHHKILIKSKLYNLVRHKRSSRSTYCDSFICSVWSSTTSNANCLNATQTICMQTYWSIHLICWLWIQFFLFLLAVRVQLSSILNKLLFIHSIKTNSHFIYFHFIFVLKLYIHRSSATHVVCIRTSICIVHNLPIKTIFNLFSIGISNRCK